MTIATTTATTPKKPARTPRKPKAAPAQQQQTVPVCNVCFAKLGWRDLAYCGGKQATMCKVCHQKSERKRLHGVPVPRERMPHATMAYGTERTAKLAKTRPAWKAAKPKQAAPKPPTEKATRQERSAKRAEKYLRKKARKAQAGKERVA